MAAFTYVFFSKMIREQSIRQLTQTLRTLGMDGVDLCVRDGYPVTPGNARETLPEAVRVLADGGMKALKRWHEVREILPPELP